MPLWLMQTIIVLIVLLIGVALFGLIYLVFWLLMRFSPRPVCPKCGNNGLRIIDGVREGRPAPGHTPPASSQKNYSILPSNIVILLLPPRTKPCADQGAVSS